MGEPAQHLMALLVSALLATLGLSTAPTAGPTARPTAKHGTRAIHRCAKRHAHRRPACRRTRHRAPSRHTIGPALVGPAPAGGSSSSGPTGGTSPGGAPGAPTPAGETPAPAPPSIPHVQVSAAEYSFTLSRSTVPPGKVILEFVNNGQDEHNLNAASEEGDLAASFHTALAKEVSHQQVELRAGTYSLFCSLPEHEAKGMKATLTVR